MGGCSSLKSEPNKVKVVLVERGEGVLHDYVILHHFSLFLELVWFFVLSSDMPFVDSPLIPQLACWWHILITYEVGNMSKGTLVPQVIDLPRLATSHFVSVKK